MPFYRRSNNIYRYRKGCTTCSHYYQKYSNSGVADSRIVLFLIIVIIYSCFTYEYLHHTPSILTPVHANISNTPVNFNVKSKVLSRALGRSESSNQPTDDDSSNNPDTAPSPAPKHNFDGVSLDLSGALDLHLSSPYHSVSTDSPSEPSTKSTTTRRNIRKMKIIPSSKTSTTAAKPLFRWGTITNTNPLTKLIYPSLHVGAKYDFQRARYGITRLLTTCTWGSRYNSRNHNHNGGTQEYDKEGTTLHVSLEKGISPNQRNHQHQHQHQITNYKDTSTTVGIELPQYILDPFVSVRWDTDCEAALSSSSSYKMMDSTLKQRINSHGRSIHPSATFVARTHIHPRIQLLLQSVFVLPNSSSNKNNDNNDNKNDNGRSHDMMQERMPDKAYWTRSYLSSRIPSQTTNWIEGSWLPDVSVTPGGMMMAKSQVGIPDIGIGEGNLGGILGGLVRSISPFLATRSDMKAKNSKPGNHANHDNHGTNQYGIRLMVKRQINWSVFGGIPSWMANDRNTNDGGNMNADDGSTLLRLEVCGMSSEGNVCNSIAMEGVMERLRDSLRLEITQDRIVPYVL